MVKRKMLGTTIVALAMGAALGPLAATAFAGTAITKGTVSLSVQGVGTGSIATDASSCGGLACKLTSDCDCLTGSDTLVGNQGFGGGSLVFSLLIDLSDTSLLTGNFGNCQAATGSAVLGNKGSKTTVTMDVSGLACSTASGTDIFNGTYVVTGGSGKYSSSSGGSGAINGSQLNSTGTGPSQVTVTGSLQRTQGG
jgi:hypothetical protein